MPTHCIGPIGPNLFFRVLAVLFGTGFEYGQRAPAVPGLEVTQPAAHVSPPSPPEHPPKNTATAAGKRTAMNLLMFIPVLLQIIERGR